LANAAIPADATAVAEAPDTVVVRNASRGATAELVQADGSAMNQARVSAQTHEQNADIATADALLNRCENDEANRHESQAEQNVLWTPAAAVRDPCVGHDDNESECQKEGDCAVSGVAHPKQLGGMINACAAGPLKPMPAIRLGPK